jgi:nitrogen fixation protein FixH
MSRQPLKRNLWPVAIIAYFAVAILGAVIFVVWAVRQDMDLVRNDYYAEELRFQKQMERVERAGQLKEAASIVYSFDDQMITVALPPDHSNKLSEGSIHFYRPSDATLDLDLKLQVSADGKQRVPTAGLQAGLWKVRLLWKVDGEEFFTDRSIIIAGKES